MSLGMILNSFLKTWVNLINCVLANKKCVFANRRNCMKTKVYSEAKYYKVWSFFESSH